MVNETRLTSWLKALGESKEEMPARNDAWVPTPNCPPLPRLLNAMVQRDWSSQELAHRERCPYCRNKRAALLALATKRKATRWPGYNCIGDYQGGIYECEFVSPYTKSARNVDTEVMVLLQDWSSHEVLSEPPVPGGLELGHDPSRNTNKRLKELLREHFNLELHQAYATNVFPFVKGGGISSGIRWGDLVRAAREFAIPQIDIIQPRVAVCLGRATFDALAAACGLPRSSSIAQAIAAPFCIGRAAVWCQRHPGWKTPNQVREEWQRMASRPAPKPINAVQGAVVGRAPENRLTAELSANRKRARPLTGSDPLGCSGYLQTEVDCYLVDACRGLENAQTPEEIAKGAALSDVNEVRRHLRYWTNPETEKSSETGKVKPRQYLRKTEIGKYYVTSDAPRLS